MLGVQTLHHSLMVMLVPLVCCHCLIGITAHHSCLLDYGKLLLLFSASCQITPPICVVNAVVQCLFGSAL